MARLKRPTHRRPAFCPTSGKTFSECLFILQRLVDLEECSVFEYEHGRTVPPLLSYSAARCRLRNARGLAADREDLVGAHPDLQFTVGDPFQACRRRAHHVVHLGLEPRESAIERVDEPGKLPSSDRKSTRLKFSHVRISY